MRSYKHTWLKILLVAFCAAASVYGFMIKLPAGFRHIDKELHSAYYFGAAAFLNLLFARKSLWAHILILVLLFLFGLSVEYAQEYSNKLLHSRIHGRFDIEDVKANLKGLVVFSALWTTGFIFIQLRNKSLRHKNKPSLSSDE